MLRIVDDALRSPTAGNSRGVSFLVLSDPSDRDAYWNHATDEAWRASSSRYVGFARAPFIVLSLCDPEVYTNRYSESDKASSGLGQTTDAWPVPYWFGDAGMATMALLLGAENQGLGAAFLGNFRNERAVLDHFEVPAQVRLFGTILLGHSDGKAHRSRSLDRRVSRTSRLHVGLFGHRAAETD